jgi:hypothetical protein
MKLEGLYRHLLLKSKRFSNNTNKIDENGQKEVTKIKIQKKQKKMRKSREIITDSESVVQK